LEQRVAERTQELEEALAEVQSVQRRYIEGQWSDYTTDAVIGDEQLPDAWLPVMETAVVKQEVITQTNGHTTMALPVRYADEVIGIMGFGGDVEDTSWDTDDISAVEAIIEQVGLALENQRLFDQTQSALLESSTLYEASAKLNAAETYEDVLEVLRKYTILGGKSHHISLNIFNKTWTKTDTPDYVQVLARISDLPENTLLPQYKLEDFPEISELLRYNQSTIVDDIDSDEARMHVAMRQLYRDVFNAKSTIFVPLAVGTQWIGFINAVYAEKTSFPDDEMQRTLALASQSAVAVSNKQLLTNTQERATQLETLSHVEAALSQANSEDEILRALMQGFDLADVSSITLNYLNHQPNDAITLDMYGFRSNGRFLPDDMLTRNHGVPMEKSPFANFWQDKSSGIGYITNITNEPGISKALLEHAEKHHWQASAIIPLRRGGVLQAVISITWHNPHKFTDGEKFLFERLLEPTAAVISSRRAQLAQQEALAETASLYRASAEMNAAQTYDDILSVVRKYTIAGQDAQSVSLSMFDRPWTNTQMPELVEVLKYHTTRENASIPTRFPLSEFPSAQQILKPDEPTVIEDLTDPELGIDDNTRALYTKFFGAQAIIFAPLVAGGQWIGYINVLYKNKRAFSESNVRRLASIAGQSAVAIQNLGLLEETSRKAQREQMLREITAQVRSSADVDTIMKTAVQEIGRALGRKTYISLEKDSKTKADTSPLDKEYGA
jgi:GAF domain-containing protein